MKMNPLKMMLLFAALFLFACSTNKRSELVPRKETSPCIINLIYFIRAVEPRIPAITEDVLYETVVNQVNQIKEYKLKGTFLLQYDALIIPRYQQLLKEEASRGSEIGGWWEITEPHVKAAGLKWRGRYPWDWHANVGFSVGYTPEEREKLVDVYMGKFKSIFGKYPTSMGSWLIDSHTMKYLYENYHIVASCNCTDANGTDGYTFWGGYWNQAYYPSCNNVYMPAQNIESQISVPIFRMLSSDPIAPYDSIRKVGYTLEPAWKEDMGGNNLKWIKWYFKTKTEGQRLAFAYIQAGQENSFTWERIKKGLGWQIPIIDSLAKLNKLQIQTLSESGIWFKNKFKVTPPTAVTALTDYTNENRKSVWYNSRFYRSNIYWEGNTFRFRDIHLFDERMESNYLKQPDTLETYSYNTLPLVDGLLWSTSGKIAGLKLMLKDASGNTAEIITGNPIVTEYENDILQVELPIENSKRSIKILFFEDRIEVTSDDAKDNLRWLLEMNAPPDLQLPFTQITNKEIHATYKGYNYSILCKEGTIVKKSVPSDAFVYRIIPNEGKVVIDMSVRK